MKIKLTSVFVEDQEKALRFYTGILGFKKKRDDPIGEFRWLTLISPENSEDIELLLEPCEHPAAKSYQRALYQDGMPLAAFAVDDTQAEYERLKQHGVVFDTPPKEVGPTVVAVFDDQCGNLIQIYQE
jgi:catechol 2,3-dioxygenase-like lactoylglutathione lyase family enzyme